MNRAFITGATGFIGARLAERLTQDGVRVTALVRTWSRAPRLARLDVNLVQGDMMCTDGLAAAMAGADTVFHCAVDNRIGGEAHRRTSAVGTENVAHAAVKAGVQRIVHVSSVAVYGYHPADDVSESSDIQGITGDAYADGKRDAEAVVRRFQQKFDLHAVILRPTIVYGPFGDWTTSTIDRLRRGQLPLVNGGDGVCNACYVDNLIEAMVLAATRAEAVGETFHVSDAETVTWRKFIEAHAGAMRPTPMPLQDINPESLEELRKRRETAAQPKGSWGKAMELLTDPAFRWQLRSVPAVEWGVRMSRRFAQSVMPMRTRQKLRERMFPAQRKTATAMAADVMAEPILSRTEQDIYTSQTVFRIDKARNLLGYAPKVDFDEGMRRTRTWIEWARLN